MKFRPDWYVGLLLRVGILWRNLKALFSGNHIRETYEKLPCGHGVKKVYDTGRQDYTVVVSDHALPKTGSTVEI